MEVFVTCPIDGAKYNKQFHCAEELSCKVCDRRYPKGIICPIDGHTYEKKYYCATERSCKVCSRRYRERYGHQGRPKTKRTH